MSSYTKRSSRGNPYHDARGRFTTANGCVTKVDYKSEFDYMVQTARRKRAANPPQKVDAYVVSGNETKIVNSDKIQKGMIVEYDPAWAKPGTEEAEAKYLFVVKDMNVNEKGRGWADIVCLNGGAMWATTQRVYVDSVRPANKEKVDKTDAEMTPEERAKMKRVSGFIK